MSAIIAPQLNYHRAPAGRSAQTLPLVLDVLDDGLQLYRQHFGAFVLIAALGLVPLFLGSRLLLSLQPRSGLAGFALLSLITITAATVLCSLVGWLSRATLNVTNHGHLQFRAVFAVRPMQIVCGGGYALVRGVKAVLYYAIGALAWALLLGMALLITGALFNLSFRFWGVGAQLSSLIIRVGALLGGYGLGVLIVGMPLMNMVYALQPWVQTPAATRVALHTRTALHTGAFDEDGMYFAAILTASSIGIICAVPIGGLLWLILALLGIPPTAIFRAAGPIVGLLALIIGLPPVAIWMALLYRHVVGMREGQPFAADVATWRAHISRSNHQLLNTTNHTERS